MRGLPTYLVLRLLLRVRASNTSNIRARPPNILRGLPRGPIRGRPGTAPPQKIKRRASSAKMQMEKKASKLSQKAMKTWASKLSQKENENMRTNQPNKYKNNELAQPN